MPGTKVSSNHNVFVSIGSNMGDARANCCRAVEILRSEPEVRLLALSPFYRTEPVDYRDQEWFINAAVKIETGFAPQELLRKLQAIQHECGRLEQKIRFGPRILDLDIIFYDDLILESPELTIPHPRMHKRRFVLQPICDIDPSVKHPVLGTDVQSLLNQLVDGGQAISRCAFAC